MEDLDKVKTMRKIRMKKGAQYLFVFRVPYVMTPDQHKHLSTKLDVLRATIEKTMGVIVQPILLEGNITLDIVEKDAERKKPGPVPPSKKPGNELPWA
jgi:hypothetical protein